MRLEGLEKKVLFLKAQQGFGGAIQQQNPPLRVGDEKGLGKAAPQGAHRTPGAGPGKPVQFVVRHGDVSPWIIPISGTFYTPIPVPPDFFAGDS
jgi:hypothetical protein